MSDSGFPFPPPGDEEREIARIADSLQMETSAPSAKPKPSPSSMPISLPLALPPQGMTHPAGIPPGGRPGPTPTANLDPATKGKLLHGLVKDLKEGKITKEQFSQQLIQTVGRHQALQIINKTQGGSRPPQPALPPGAKPPPTAAPQPQSLPPQAPTSSAGQNQMMMLKMQQQGKLPNAPVPIARPQGGQPVDPQMQRLLQLQLQQQMNMGAKIPLPSAEEQRKMLMFANRLPQGTLPQGTLPPQVGGVAMPQPQAGATQPAAKKPRTSGPTAGGNPPKGGSQVKAEKESDKGGNRNETLKDLSDVTRIAGVNLKEETNTFMASMPTAGESSEPDVDAINPLLNRQLLQKKVHALLAANGLQPTVGDPVYELITLALTERMRDILEHLATFAEHRQNTGIEFKTATTSDPRTQLRNIEKREKEEHERRDEQLASDISSKILGESTEQRRQLQKAQLQEEEERMRTKHANLTALQAIGDTRSRPRAPPAGAAPPQPTPTTPTPTPTTTPQPPPSQQQLAVAMALSRFKPEQLQLMQRYQAMDKEGTITPQQKQQLVQFQVTLQKLQEKYRAAATATQTTTPGGTSSTTASSKAGPSTTQVTMQDVSFLFQTDPFLHRKSKLAIRHPLDNRTHSSS